MSVISISSSDDIEEFNLAETDDEEDVEETVQVFVDENCIESSNTVNKKVSELAQTAHTAFALPDHLDYTDNTFVDCTRPVTPLFNLLESNSNQDNFKDPLLIEENCSNTISPNVFPQDGHGDSIVMREPDNTNCNILVKTNEKCSLLKQAGIIDIQLYKISVDNTPRVGCETNKSILSEMPPSHSSNLSAIDLKPVYKDKFQRIAESLATILNKKENFKKFVQPQTNKQLLSCEKLTINSLALNVEIKGPGRKKKRMIKSPNPDNLVPISVPSNSDEKLIGSELNTEKVNHEDVFERSGDKVINKFNLSTLNAQPKKRGRKKGWSQKPEILGVENSGNKLNLLTLNTQPKKRGRKKGWNQKTEILGVENSGNKLNLSTLNTQPKKPGRKRGWSKKTEILGVENSGNKLNLSTLNTEPKKRGRKKGWSNKTEKLRVENSGLESNPDDFKLSIKRTNINEKEVNGSLGNTTSAVQYEEQEIKTVQVKKMDIEDSFKNKTNTKKINVKNIKRRSHPVSCDKKDIKTREITKKIKREVIFESNEEGNCFNSSNSSKRPESQGRRKGWRKNPEKYESNLVDLKLSIIKSSISEIKDEGPVSLEQTEGKEIMKLQVDKCNVDVLCKNNTDSKIMDIKNTKEKINSYKIPLIKNKYGGSVIRERKVLCSKKTIENKECLQVSENKNCAVNCKQEETTISCKAIPTARKNKPGRKKGWRKNETEMRNTICSKFPSNDVVPNEVNTELLEKNNKILNQYQNGSLFKSTSLKTQLVNINSEQKNMTKKVMKMLSARSEISVFEKLEDRSQSIQETPIHQSPIQTHQNDFNTSNPVTEKYIKATFCNSDVSLVKSDLMVSSTNSTSPETTKSIEQRSVDVSRFRVSNQSDKNDLDPRLTSIEHLTNISEVDLKLLKSNFISNYTKLFDVDSEKKCVEMGNFLLLTMKEARNYKLRVSLSDNSTCDKLRIKEIRIAKQNYENSIKQYRRSFEILFVEIHKQILYTVDSAQQKNMVVALFLKLFLRAAYLSPDFSNCLLDAKLNFVALISKKVFNYPLVFVVFSCNETMFEKDCCLILEFMKDCASVNDHLLCQENVNISHSFGNNNACENNGMNDLAVQSSLGKRKNTNELNFQIMKKFCVAEDKEINCNEINTFTFNSSKNTIVNNLTSPGDKITLSAENIMKLNPEAKLSVIHNESKVEHCKIKNINLKCNQPFVYEKKVQNAEKSPIKNTKDVPIDKSQMLSTGTNLSERLSSSPIKCMETEDLSNFDSLTTMAMKNISRGASDPTSFDSLDKKRKPVDFINNKNKVFKSDNLTSTICTSMPDVKAQRISTPHVSNSVNNIRNPHVPNNQALAGTYQEQQIKRKGDEDKHYIPASLEPSRLPERAWRGSHAIVSQRPLSGMDNFDPFQYYNQQCYFPRYQQYHERYNSQSRRPEMFRSHHMYQQASNPWSYYNQPEFPLNYSNVPRGEERR